MSAPCTRCERERLRLEYFEQFSTNEVLDIWVDDRADQVVCRLKGGVKVRRFRRGT